MAQVSLEYPLYSYHFNQPTDYASPLNCQTENGLASISIALTSPGGYPQQTIIPLALITPSKTKPEEHQTTTKAPPTDAQAWQPKVAQVEPLLPELSQLPLSHDILWSAQQELKKFDRRPRRYTPKKQVILLALDRAYQKHGQVIDPYDLGKLLGLNQKQVRDGYNKFYIHFNLEAPGAGADSASAANGYTNPIDLIPTIAASIGCNEAMISEIQEYVRYRGLLMTSGQASPTASPLAERNNPQLVALALTLYYLMMSGYQVDLASLFKTSDEAKAPINSINSLLEKIKYLDNC